MIYFLFTFFTFLHVEIKFKYFGSCTIPKFPNQLEVMFNLVLHWCRVSSESIDQFGHHLLFADIVNCPTWSVPALLFISSFVQIGHLLTLLILSSFVQIGHLPALSTLSFFVQIDHFPFSWCYRPLLILVFLRFVVNKLGFFKLVRIVCPHCSFSSQLNFLSEST